jgi:HEAT repeat protein
MKKYALFLIFAAQLCSQLSGAAAAPSAVMDLLQLPPENRRMLLKQPGGEEIFKKLSEIAFSEEQSMTMRWKALVSLADMTSDRALPLLKKAGESSKWFMRNAALVAMEETHPLQAEILARKLLKDKALVVRSAAVQTLKKFSSPENRDLLWSELDEKYNYRKETSLWIRPQILEVLGQKPESRELKIFARLLKDKDVRMGVAAVRGLENITGTKLNETPVSAEK